MAHRYVRGLVHPRTALTSLKNEMDDSASANKFLKFYARQIGRENLELFYRKKVPWRATGDSDALDDTCQHFILNTNRRMFRLNLARKGFKVLFLRT